jgi:hypothetical protein
MERSDFKIAKGYHPSNLGRMLRDGRSGLALGQWRRHFFLWGWSSTASSPGRSPGSGDSRSTRAAAVRSSLTLAASGAPSIGWPALVLFQNIAASSLVERWGAIVLQNFSKRWRDERGWKPRVSSKSRAPNPAIYRGFVLNLMRWSSSTSYRSRIRSGVGVEQDSGEIVDLGKSMPSFFG